MTRIVVVVAMIAASLVTPWAAPAQAQASAPTKNGCVRPAAGTPIAPSSISPYQQAVSAAAQRGLQVWVEADLLKRWWAGPASFDEGVQRLADLAHDPAVAGFKIADELGYHDDVAQSPACMRAFVIDAARALRRVAPHAQLLVDLLVPDLGCAPDLDNVAPAAASCRASNDAKYPALALREVDRLFRLKALDTVDLSTGVLDAATYGQWGIDQQQAQSAAWREVSRRRWARFAAINARKALAHPGTYSGGAASAETDVGLYVDVPEASGARAVDVWTWRQSYSGDLYRILDPGMKPNALWDALAARRASGSVLFTHFSPSSVETGVGPDLDMLSQVFRGVFVAAGAG
jgi:hypothetical protein